MSEVLTSVPMTACPGKEQRETTGQELSAKPADGAQLHPPAQSRLFAKHFTQFGHRRSSNDCGDNFAITVDVPGHDLTVEGQTLSHLAK